MTTDNMYNGTKNMELFLSRIEDHIKPPGRSGMKTSSIACESLRALQGSLYPSLPCDLCVCFVISFSKPKNEAVLRLSLGAAHYSSLSVATLCSTLQQPISTDLVQCFKQPISTDLVQYLTATYQYRPCAVLYSSLSVPT
nr:hypothetical protein BgiMline_029129 [Biomphalaria glabrata]